MKTKSKAKFRITWATRARSTGASVVALREREEWETVCLNHNQIAAHKTRAEAEKLASHPQEWCADCLKIAEGKAAKIAEKLEVNQKKLRSLVAA